MSLLIALFMIVCFLCIIASEKMNNRAHKSLRRKSDDEFTTFLDNYSIDYKVSDSLKEGGEKRKGLDETFLRIKNETNIKYPTISMVVLGYYAQYLKIPYEYIYGGITCDRFDNSQEVYAFVVWYNNALKSHGFKYDIFFYIGAGISGNKECVSIDSDISAKLGDYNWCPMERICRGTSLYKYGEWHIRSSNL